MCNNKIKIKTHFVAFLPSFDPETYMLDFKIARALVIIPHNQFCDLEVVIVVRIECSDQLSRD